MRTGLIISFLLIFILFAENAESKPFYSASNADSLKQIVSSQKDDFNKVDSLIELSKMYLSIDMDSAMLFADEALALSIQLDYKVGQLDAIYRKGYLHKMQEDYQAAFEHFELYLSLSETLLDSLRMSRGYFQYASIYRIQAKNRLAVFFYEKSLQLYIALNNTGGMISNYNGLGITFKNSAKYDSAAIYYLKTIELIKATGKKSNLPKPYHNLGSVYMELMDMKNARKTLNTALAYTDTAEQKKTLAIIYSKLGSVANEEMKLDSALNYYKKAENIYRKIKYQRGISDLYINYGIVFQKKGLYDLAYHNFKLALNYYKQHNLKDGIITAWQNMATFYLNQGKYALALKTMDSCINLTTETGHNKKRLDALRYISKIYYRAGSYKNSSDYYSKYETLKDSIYALEKEEIVAVLRIQYDRELDRAKILTMQIQFHRKIKQRNMYFLIGISIIALVSLFFILYLRLKARKNKTIAKQRITQLEEEKKLLAARFLVEGQEEERKRIATELHDGLGVLLSATKLQFTAIKDPTPENKPLIEKATQFLDQASSDVRKISHNMMPGLLTKLGLCEALEDLFEKLEDTKGMEAVCAIKGARERLPQNQEIMIYRIVQEMVNNTLKHSGAKEIALMISVLPSKLDILFTDNGKGFNVDQMLEKKSMGLQSIISRVKFLNGTVSINSSPGKGVEFALQIPVSGEQ